MIFKAGKLINEVRACTICAPFLPLGPRPIFQFNPKARILIVGQAPGRKAHAAGIPFSDASGDRLRRWLGVSRDEFYDETLFALLPMGFCYPGTGASGDLPPRPECAAQWRKPMLALLPDISLTLLMGRYAIDWHLPQERRKPLTGIVAGWRIHWPNLLVLPHSSPRNTYWLQQHKWFEAEAVPELQARVSGLIRV